MSEARLELVEPCEHGFETDHYICDGCENERWTAHPQESVERLCSAGSRRVLSVPTDQMVEAGIEMLCAMGRGSVHESRAMRNAGNWAAVRVILEAAFNTLDIQEKADTTQNPS
jgi:hypothetical protein